MNPAAIIFFNRGYEMRMRMACGGATYAFARYTWRRGRGDCEMRYTAVGPSTNPPSKLRPRPIF